MGSYVEAPVRSFEAGGAIAQFLRVKLGSGVLSAAGAEDEDIGTIEIAALASGDKVPVRIWNAQGTRKMVASAAITSGAKVYGAAGGKISSTATGNAIGIALEAAAGNNSVIEVLTLPGKALRVDFGQHTTIDANDTVVTGLATVVAVVASFNDAPVEAAKFVSADVGDQAGAPAAGSFLLKTHKDTDADAAIVDATTFSIKVNWIALGT